MHVVAVYKTSPGRRFGPTAVMMLQRRVAHYLPQAEFTVLTDDESIEGRVPLRHGWPGWFSKPEAFRPGLFKGPVLYMDLDTMPVADFSVIASYAGPPALLSDFNEPAYLASGLMAWSGDAMAHLYDDFVQRADEIMQPRRGMNPPRLDWWLRDMVGNAPRLQDLFPGQIVSFKNHCRGGTPDGASIVCFHGDPTPDDLPPDHALRTDPW